LYHIETNDKRCEVGGPGEAENIMQTRENFLKCLPPFLCPQNCSALFVGRASAFIICSPIKFLLWFAYLRA